ncbi:MAG: gamma-glutamylcyclotransferase [Thermodesulfobacteriales bacterium]|nr:MAG: gamma-glutamylcyclotransferase [Thermodesulfobacteriales bacterium]
MSPSSLMEQVDRTQVINYFAYGSNMNPVRMRERGVLFYSRKLLILPGYSLKFNKTVSSPNAGAANIVTNAEGLVEGILYQITLKGMLNLDRYEHYPAEYDRVTLRVSNQGKNDIEIKTYIAHPHKTRDGLKPTKSYLDHLLEAEDLMSEDYYNQLKIVETLD